MIALDNRVKSLQLSHTCQLHSPQRKTVFNLSPVILQPKAVKYENSLSFSSRKIQLGKHNKKQARVIHFIEWSQPLFFSFRTFFFCCCTLAHVLWLAQRKLLLYKEKCHKRNDGIRMECALRSILFYHYSTN